MWLPTTVTEVLWFKACCEFEPVATKSLVSSEVNCHLSVGSVAV